MAEALTETLAPLLPLATLPWVPLLITSAESQINLFCKSHFTEDSYLIVITDLRRVWMEDAPEFKVKRGVKEYAPAYTSTPLPRLLSYLKQFVEAQKPDVKYSAFCVPDEAGQLQLKITGRIGAQSIKWIFELDQLDTSATAPRLAPGDVTYGFISLPAFLMAGEYARRCEDLLAVLEKKEREIEQCHVAIREAGLKHKPARSETFDKEKFRRRSDRTFRDMPINFDAAAQSIFMDHSRMFQLAMSKVSPESNVSGLLSSDGITSSDAYPGHGYGPSLATDFLPSEALTLPTGPLNSTGFFQTYEHSQSTQPAHHVSQPTTSQSLRERDPTTEEERRHEREERLKKLKAEEANKKKKRKII
ncbi:hypothetical protein HDV00_002242 [Rhizophlyctis rosea]|nr:hypothetical protein HDV00_002242 [Rhizophlyctis rosea]